MSGDGGEGDAPFEGVRQRIWSIVEGVEVDARMAVARFARLPWVRTTSASGHLRGQLPGRPARANLSASSVWSETDRGEADLMGQEEASNTNRAELFV